MLGMILRVGEWGDILGEWEAGVTVSVTDLYATEADVGYDLEGGRVGGHPGRVAGGGRHRDTHWEGADGRHPHLPYNSKLINQMKHKQWT